MEVAAVTPRQMQTTLLDNTSQVHRMVAMGGMWSVAQTISAELFPTRLRATANGLTHNLIGRMGMVFGPAAVGVLVTSLGSVGDAVALLGLANFVAIPLLLWLLPETRGAQLSGTRDEPC